MLIYNLALLLKLLLYVLNLVPLRHPVLFVLVCYPYTQYKFIIYFWPQRNRTTLKYTTVKQNINIKSNPTVTIVPKITGYSQSGNMCSKTKYCTYNLQTVERKYNVPEKEINIRRIFTSKVYFLTSKELQKVKFIQLLRLWILLFHIDTRLVPTTKVNLLFALFRRLKLADTVHYISNLVIHKGKHSVTVFMGSK